MMNSKYFKILPLLMAGGLIVLDQVSKYAAAVYLKGKEPVTLIPSVLKLQYLYPENRGIAFGLMQGGTVLFSALAILLLSFLLLIFFRLPGNRRMTPLFISGALLFSGAAGNLIDRVFRGYVIDFIYFYLIDFPLFNIADVCVVTGSVLLAVLILFVYKEDELQLFKGK